MITEDELQVSRSIRTFYGNVRLEKIGRTSVPDWAADFPGSVVRFAFTKEENLATQVSTYAAGFVIYHDDLMEPDRRIMPLELLRRYAIRVQGLDTPFSVVGEIMLIGRDIRLGEIDCHTVGPFSTTGTQGGGATVVSHYPGEKTT